ncbi:MAG: 6-phospho-beta-glucosidase [Acetanaerobacterium sp.]
MSGINIAVIGSGSTYTPELIDGLVRLKDTLPVARLVLMDIDRTKREIVGALCKRIWKNAGLPDVVELTDDLDTALAGADFVVAQIRVGKLPARHLDETIPLKYNLIGQETTGIGGFFKALRTIPAVGNIAKRMEVLCPRAWLINFSNPSGILSEYLTHYTSIRSIGLCNCPINMVDEAKKAVKDDRAQVAYIGLNHLSWITAVFSSGNDRLPALLKQGYTGTAMSNIVDDGFDLNCMRACGGIPSSYLQYYYGRNKKLQHLKEAPTSRAQDCMEIERNLLALYSDTSLVEKPALLDKRGGHKYSLAAISLINSIANDLQDVHIINIPNGQTLSFMEVDDVIETAAVVGRNGYTAQSYALPVSAHMSTMMKTVKAYEKYTVQAAVEGNDDAAINALMLHPLLGDFDTVQSCYKEMKEANKAYLPQFYKD